MKHSIRKMKLITFLICCLFLTVQSRAQSIDSTLAVYSEQYAQERLYLHYDKSAYSAGETVWYKAYLMEGINAAEGSKTLYVDWVDDKGKVLKHNVHPIVEAVATGSFDVPQNFTAGAVHVQAYTKWMLNFDSALLYSKNIRILNNKPSASKVAPVISLQFFPEGGDMVAGVKNKIAFKAADQWGQPVKIRGVVQNSKGATIDSLKVVHDGMGYFMAMPLQGDVYTAKWKDAKGGEHTTPLPQIKPSGVTLQIALDGTKRIFTVGRPATVADNLKQLHLIGTMHQHLVFKANANLTETNSVSGTIPTAELPSGILTITLFDADWNAVAERITFVNNNEYSFPVEFNVEHWGLSKRARDEVQIVVPKGISANLSVSITDAGIERDSSDNIISRLLLTSELKGRVHNPQYYFMQNSEPVSEALDLVMLTNGWRRFKWEDVVKGKLPDINYAKDTGYLTLSGKVYGIMPNQLRDAGNIVMIVKASDSSSQILNAAVKADGTFNDPNLVFFDTLQIFYQFQKAKYLDGADVRFMNNRLPSLQYQSGKSAAFNYLFSDTAGLSRHLKLAMEMAEMKNMENAKILEAVTVQAKTKAPEQILDEKYTSGLFRGSDSYQFDLTNNPLSSGYTNIFSYLQGKVAGLQINANGGTPSLQWRGSTPMLYLNEMATDASMISSISVNDVAYIKVFRPPFIGGFGGGAGGAIAIYTKKGGEGQSGPGKGLATNKVSGYSPEKEFYSPNYGSFTKENEQRDLRTTLYWNPSLVTSAQQNTITLSFYNNDVSESFRVVVEGMTKDGKLTHLEQVME